MIKENDNISLDDLRYCSLLYKDFNDENLKDSIIRGLTQKVSVFEDEQLTVQSPAIRGARVIICLKNGKAYEHTVLYPKGEPENPISYEEIKQKTVALLQDYKNGYLAYLLNHLEF